MTPPSTPHQAGTTFQALLAVPQSLAFKHQHEHMFRAGMCVGGISTQPLAEQYDFAHRHQIPFPLLCDESLALQAAWSLPLFSVGHRNFLKRMVLYAESSELRSVIYPVTDPGKSADEILRRLGLLLQEGTR